RRRVRNRGCLRLCGSSRGPRSKGSIQVDVPDRLGGVHLGLFEELLELAVQDVLLRLLGLDGRGELLLTLHVVRLQSLDRVVDRLELADDFRRLVRNDRLQLRVDLQLRATAGTDELEVHGKSLRSPPLAAAPVASLAAVRAPRGGGRGKSPPHP